jgi:serine/threonine protein phosphatase PrpC
LSVRNQDFPKVQPFPDAFSGQYGKRKLHDTWRNMEASNGQISMANLGLPGNLLSGSIRVLEIGGSPRIPGNAAVLQVSSHSVQGRKREDPNCANQDAYLEINITEGKKLLGVFDGHGNLGEHVSNKVKGVFAELAHSIASASDTQGAFKQAFAQARNRIMQANIGEGSGTTATVALVDSVKKSVSIAYVGDSTATVFDSRGNLIFQSEDHKPSNEKEAQRLRACGSQVKNGRLLLNGQPEIHTGFSRAIGDFRFAQQGVVAEPDVVLDVRFEAGSSLVLASDGLWDVLPKGTVAQMVAQSPDSATNLVRTARSAWMQTQLHIDDITVVVAKSM